MGPTLTTSLAQRVRTGDVRALARALTRVENRAPDSFDILRQLFPHTGQAQVIGITGSPGVGKSSIVDRMAAAYRKRGNSPAVVAVDPSSPFTGGAILGDRIRMSILFGLLHRTNPDASLLSTVNTSIAGVMLSLAYLRTRSLWFPYGIHVAWNILIGPVVGFPISGVGFPSLWTAQVTGPERIVGGGYGPEGGFLGTLVFFCGAVAAWGLVKVQVSPQVRATITRNADKLYAADL